jgi:hypothetical protein
MLVGSTVADVQAVQAAEARYRAALAKRYAVPRARARAPEPATALGTRIGRIEVLPGLPEQPRARQLLERSAAQRHGMPLCKC